MKEAVVIILILSLSTIIYGQRALLSNGDFSVQGKSYHVMAFDEPTVDRAAAIAYCSGLDMAMDLPDMATPDKELALYNGLRGLGHGTSSTTFWTSGARGLDGRWMWTNLGREMTYTNWASGSEPEPGNDFAYFTFREGYYSWWARPENQRFDLVVCQQRKKKCHQGL